MACGICGTDVHAYKKGGGTKPQERLILGHEFSGEIAGVGSAVQGLNMGDRVVGIGYRNCGSCYRCQQGQAEWCPQPLVPGEGLDGAFAEYVIVPRPTLGKTFFHIPEGLGWEEAATIEPIAVACYAVITSAHPAEGDGGDTRRRDDWAMHSPGVQDNGGQNHCQ